MQVGFLYIMVGLYIWKVTLTLIAGPYYYVIQLLHRVYVSYCMSNAVVDHHLTVIVLALYFTQFQLFNM